VIFRAVNQGSVETGFIGDVGEASVERDAGGFAARLGLYSARRNALAE